MTYIVQRYERHPFYEPAEGGYYYEGRFPDDEYIRAEIREDSISRLKTLVDEYNQGVDESEEGFIVISNDGTHAYSINHKYIGDGEEFFVEPINRRGRHTTGRQVYC